MVEKKKITIVTVVLNAQDTIIQTIQSVIKQNFKDYEYIIIEGNSSDLTRSRIYKFKKSISKIIQQKKNGIYSAMNLAIKHSKGEWIFFLNSGDMFYNNYVLSNVFNKIYNEKIIYANVLKSYRYFKINWSGKNFNKNTLTMPFSHQSAFVRTDLLRKNLFNIKYTIISDFIFFYYCFLKNLKFRKINNYISIISTDGISNNKRIFSIIESIKFFFNIKKLYICLKLLLLLINQSCILFLKKILYKKNFNKLLKIKNRFI